MLKRLGNTALNNKINYHCFTLLVKLVLRSRFQPWVCTLSFKKIKVKFKMPSRAKAYANIRWLGSSRARPKSYEKISRANQNELACPPLARVPVVAQACSVLLKCRCLLFISIFFWCIYRSGLTNHGYACQRWARELILVGTRDFFIRFRAGTRRR